MTTTVSDEQTKQDRIENQIKDQEDKPKTTNVTTTKEKYIEQTRENQKDLDTSVQKITKFL